MSPRRSARDGSCEGEIVTAHEPAAVDRSRPRRHPVRRRPLVRRRRFHQPLPAANARPAGAPEGVVAVADEQTAGRGRLGRTWVAPAGSALLVSVLLRPALPVERTHLVTLAAGLAALDAVDALASARPRGRSEVAERRRGRRPQARGDPRRGRRRGRGGRRDGLQRAARRAAAPTCADIATAVAGRSRRAARRLAARVRRAARPRSTRSSPTRSHVRRRSAGGCASSSRARRSRAPRPRSPTRASSSSTAAS